MRNNRYFRKLGLISIDPNGELIDYAGAGGGMITPPADYNPVNAGSDPGAGTGAGTGQILPEPVYPIQPVFPIDPLVYPSPPEQLPANTAPIAPGAETQTDTALWWIMGALVVGYFLTKDE